MKRAKDVEETIRNLRCPAEAGTHARILGNLLDVLNQRQNQPAGRAPAVRRMLMKNPITRSAAAAVFVVGAVLLIGLLTRTTTVAYALDQTAAANQGLRFLHIKDFAAGHEDAPKEFWITCHEDGSIENVRYFIPLWSSPDDGAKSIVWSRGVAQIWFHRKNSLLIYRNDTIPDWVSSVTREIDPRNAVERLRAAEAQGKLKLEVRQPADLSRPIVVTATYLTDGAPNGRRDILYVDQATKLAVAAEFERLGADGQYVAQKRQEYSDYNVPIAASRFTLDNEVPADIIRVDQVTRDVGLAQGTMTDKEAAAETVRRFFEALKAQDYDKAGSLMGGIPAAKMQEWFGKMKVVGIVSVGEPEPFPIPGVGGFAVPCEIQIQGENGQVFNRSFPRVAVRPVDTDKQPDRWNIHGGI